MTEIKPNLETKWDILYDPSKKSLFSKLEEFAINNYFSTHLSNPSYLYKN